MMSTVSEKAALVMLARLTWCSCSSRFGDNRCQCCLLSGSSKRLAGNRGSRHTCIDCASNTHVQGVSSTGAIAVSRTCNLQLARTASMLKFWSAFAYVTLKALGQLGPPQLQPQGQPQ